MGNEDKLTVPSREPSPVRKHSSDLNDLKRQRGNLRGRLTQFRKYIDGLQNVSLSQLQIKEIKFRITSASEHFKLFNEIENKIELICPDSDIPLNIDYVESFESLYFTTLAVAETLTECDETGTSSSCKDIHSANVKLPEIKLPTFDGSYDHWLEYKNSYVTMIHNRSELNSIQKFHYLRSSLSGSALQVISALEFTASNYIHAWELLENRFHNARLLVHNHLKSLFSISCLKHESALQIRKLIDSVLRNLRALKTLDEPTDSWDTLVIYLIVSKLDSSTERDWENHIGTVCSQPSRKLKLDDLLTFLRNKADMLDMITSSSNKSQPKTTLQTENKPSNSKNNVSVHSYVGTSNTSSKVKPSNAKKPLNRTCASCNGNHNLYTCFKFLNLSIKDRIKFVNDNSLCCNCLRAGHSSSDCLFGPCKQCQRKHNTLLHLSGSDNNEVDRARNECSYDSPAVAASTALHSSLLHRNSTKLKRDVAMQQVLLCTALVEIIDESKRVHTARALLDSGSQHCFITDKLAKLLNIPTIQSTVQISGVAGSVTRSNLSCNIIIRSKQSDYFARVRCFVLQRITSSLPTTNIDTQLIRIPPNINLADPAYHTPAEIDLLIGADLFWEILSDNRILLVNGPYLQDSKLGWLLSGPIMNGGQYELDETQCNFIQLDEQLKRFWEIENVSQSHDVLTNDERFCEELFINTTKREAGGRFSVRIPLKESPTSLGDSFNLAKNRFLSLERKLERSPDYKRMYCDFMREYESLGHMTQVEQINEPNYFLPHHGVFKESSSTTKLRVVFNASAATTSDKSLNEIQFPGPALQNDIFSMLLRFRRYKYVACADVEKMFRQVLIQEDQRSLQLILWRERPMDPLKIYQLNTVTYGTSSAPYLSMRCIRQLAFDCSDPRIVCVILNDIFVDDLITGDDDREQLMSICERVSQVLQSGCFTLRKWTFNSDAARSTPSSMFIGEHVQNKTLGIGWHSDSDELYYATKINIDSRVPSVLTKRVMLSIISQIYDPLGLLSPIVIIAKILLQKLWLSKLDWDTPVPRNLELAWNNFFCTLEQLDNLNIPRHVRSDCVQYTELHIFSDASQDAYGACAYIRTYNDDDNLPVSVKLLCAKTKVAPLKSLSIPRLELCAALVGAKLYIKITESMRLTFTKTYFWTDSTIVIGWLRMSPHLLKTFVQNRVTEINELTRDSRWLHVASTNNPADILSRGMNAELLINCELWWNGPSYLHSRNNEFSSDLINITTDINNLPELKSQSLNFTCVTTASDLLQFEKYSSFNKLKRIGAYILRFINNIRTRSERKQKTGSLSVEELLASERMLVTLAQRQSFPSVYHNLLNNLPLKRNTKEFSKISGLNVFLDENKLIRVGGRLMNSTNFDFNKKHPILLCNKHHLTILIVRSEHKRLFHAGPQLLLYNIRERWWPIRARNLTRKIVHQCVVCARIKGKTLNPIMGNLPRERLDVGCPFLRTGVDYAGPMYILNRRGRGARLEKAYVCLFVCFLTRAVHLELVTSLSTNDYILALKRFISRRGKPEVLYSDNGKNFVGAERELSRFLKCHSSEIVDSAANDGIKFHFIPPYSPHFAGLCERGVRSCKHHLRRIVGNARLTYEEFSTVLTQIESILNSRPMSPMSADPNDLTPLTPGHFLIGRPLATPAYENLVDATTPPLNRYRRIEQLRQQFWQRWAKEYVSELQLRTKWKSHENDLSVDDLVLVKEDNIPPLKWRLGRVIKIFPGADGVPRVADIRTSSGTIRRSFPKLCPLPQLDDPEDEA